MFGRRPTFGASESALASARAEVAAAQARTRDIEKERARLEAELGRTGSRPTSSAPATSRPSCP
jgi:hypothetical protein